ncbi:MAG: hypothetical protein COA78_03085 [Blastopirellula sp.]|nr:MAG: hypothetical protein COA78_03085 [Blastopirellula sp.]
MNKISRRNLLKSASASTALLAATQFDKFTNLVHAAESSTDSLSMQLFKSLNDEQREKICLPVDHEKRYYISNWWYIQPDHRIPTTFNKEQQELIQATFDSLHTPEHRAAVNKQVEGDQYGAAKNAPSIGFFGSPEDKDFEFIYTGHHVTRRCNVHSVAGQGFGGAPIFYGHFPDEFTETKDHPGNAYWYQGKIFNEFVQSLDGKQQKKALTSSKPRTEKPASVIEMHKDNQAGLSCASLSSDQQELLLNTMAKMMGMFRKTDVDATLDTIKKKKMIDQLHVSYYDGKFDVGSDQVWDTWQIEGPEMVWYYRGHPHIHSYFHLKS